MTDQKMNRRTHELMVDAGYVAPEYAPRAQGLVELVVRECVELLAREYEEPHPSFKELLFTKFGIDR